MQAGAYREIICVLPLFVLLLLLCCDSYYVLIELCCVSDITFMMISIGILLQRTDNVAMFSCIKIVLH